MDYIPSIGTWLRTLIDPAKRVYVGPATMLTNQGTYRMLRVVHALRFFLPPPNVYRQ